MSLNPSPSPYSSHYPNKTTTCYSPPQLKDTIVSGILTCGITAIGLASAYKSGNIQDKTLRQLLKGVATLGISTGVLGTCYIIFSRLFQCLNPAIPTGILRPEMLSKLVTTSSLTVFTSESCPAEIANLKPEDQCKKLIEQNKNEHLKELLKEIDLSENDTFTIEISIKIEETKAKKEIITTKTTKKTKKESNYKKNELFLKSFEDISKEISEEVCKNLNSKDQLQSVLINTTTFAVTPQEVAIFPTPPPLFWIRRGEC